MPACNCPRHRAYGFTLISHHDTCQHAAIGACTGCGHDIVPGEDNDHELCAAA